MEGINYPDFYRAQGLEPAKIRGDEWDCRCPFHQDSKPSLNVNVRTGQWQCHACGEKGNEVTFYAKLHNCSTQEAARTIKGSGPASPPPRRPVTFQPKPSEPPKFMNPKEAEEAHSRLLKAKQPLAWLQEARGLTLESVKRFRLGLTAKGDRITIPIYDEEGRLLNLRLYDWQHKSDQKFLNTKGFGTIRLWPAESLKADSVVLVEGEPDCLLACQLGYAALTGTGGAGNWKAEWSEQLRGKSVAIIYDADQAGRDGRQKVAEALAGVAREIRLVDLPLPGTKDDKDLTDYVLKHGATKADLDALISAATVYGPPKKDPEQEASVDDLLADLPEHINFQEHQTAYQKIVKQIAAMRPGAREYYINLVKERFKIGKGAIREDVKLQEMALKIEPAVPQALDAPRDFDLCLAQDMRGEVFHYLIYISTNKGTFVPRLVTSERQLVEIPEEKAEELPEDTNRWSLDKLTPFNVFEFLAGSRKVNPVDLYAEIEAFIRRFMWYGDERLYKLIPLWIMESYVFMVFDEVGYLALVGTKRTGKTRLFEILEMLCFNATMSSSATDAYIYRTVERSRATLLFDEADSLRKAPKEAVNEKLEIIRSGYKRFGKVGRCEGENSRTVTFSTYSMKAIANVTGLEEALEDRVIHVNVERKPKEVQVEKMLKRELRDTAQVLRNKLYFFGLQHAKPIADIYRSYRPEGLEDREAEIWGGLLSLARYLNPVIHDEILTLAIDNRKRKELREGLESNEAQMIMAIWSLVREGEPMVVDMGRKYFSAERTKEVILEQLGWESLTYNRLAGELVKLRIIEDTEEYKKRVKTRNDKGHLIRKMCYLLDPVRIARAATKYSVELDDLPVEVRMAVSQIASTGEEPWE